MTINRKEKLINLIERMRKTKEFSWLSNIQLQKADFIVRDKNELPPKENIKNTYSIRLAINQDRGNPIKGFETFISNLNNSKTEHICIHQMMDADGDNYRIFTDPDIEELIGVLRLIKKEFGE